jgi:uncharacterized membrane protein YgcG
LTPGIADTTQSLTQAEQKKLLKEIARIQRRFPQLVLQLVVHEFSTDYPFSMHAFWLFNGGNFAGDSRRGKDNHALLLALDPVRGEAAIVPGYGLEPFMRPETLDHVLRLGDTAWQDAKWADGIYQVLDGLDSLLESISISDDSRENPTGEF